MKSKILLLSLSILFISCASGPEKTAEKFTESMAEGKVEEAKKYATESTGKLIDFASGFGGVPIDPNYEFKMVKDSVDDNKAWVTYIDQDGKEDTLELVKIDGKWLVHIESKK